LSGSSKVLREQSSSRLRPLANQWSADRQRDRLQGRGRGLDSLEATAPSRAEFRSREGGWRCAQRRRRPAGRRLAWAERGRVRSSSSRAASRVLEVATEPAPAGATEAGKARDALHLQDRLPVPAVQKGLGRLYAQVPGAGQEPCVKPLIEEGEDISVEIRPLPARVYVDRLGEQILVVAEPRGAITLTPSAAVEIARELLNEALVKPTDD